MSHPSRDSYLDTLLIALFKTKGVFFLVFLLGITATILWIVFSKPEFKSTTVLKINSSTSESIGLSKISSIGSLMSSLGDETSSQLLDSRELKVAVIKRFGLQKKWKCKYLATALKRLGHYYEVNILDDDGYYEISFYHTSPDTAKMVLDFVVARLDQRQRELRQHYAASKFSLFQGIFDSQLETLTKISDTIVDYMKTNRVYEAETQAKQIMELAADVDKEIVSTNIEIKSLYDNYWNKGSTQHNALLKKLELLKAYKASVLQGSANSGGKVLHPSITKIPEVGQKLKLMDGKIQLQEESMLLTIAQLEKYRLEMEDSTSQIMVLDSAFIPDYKTRPKRAIFLVIGFVATCLLASFFSLLVAARKFPEMAEIPLIRRLGSLRAGIRNARNP
ncbi:MAG TPA: hypothetical protein VLM37_01190 [Fibrobacteraceae bacterium]|nr:hypothetical protein [Fibrobacteraceae bacterium]